MNAVDGGLLLILLLSALVGLWRGLVYEVLSVLTWVAAFLLAQGYAQQAAEMLPLGNLSAPLKTAAGFVSVFIGSAVIGGLVAASVKRMVAAVGLRPIDRVLGGLFGLLRGGVVLLALAIVVGLTPLRSHSQWQDSAVAQLLDTGLAALKPLLPQAVAKHLS